MTDTQTADRSAEPLPSWTAPRLKQLGGRDEIENIFAGAGPDGAIFSFVPTGS